MTRRRLHIFLLGTATSIVFVAACADIFGVRNADVDGGSADGGTDAIADVPYDYVVHDAIDIDVNTAVCEGGIPLVDAGDAVWVSVALGDDGNACTQSSPCKTIAGALQKLAGRNVVYLDNSVFIETVTLGAAQSNLTIQGGWLTDAGWTPTCDTKPTIIQGPEDGGSAAVEIANATGVTLRLLTVKSKVNGLNVVGESVYAVRVVDSPNILLDNVTLLAQNAGGGAPGSTPNDVFVGCPSPGSGGGGSSGSGGTPGTFANSGFVPTTGGDGSAGQNGTLSSPQPGSCGMCNQGCP